MKILLYFSTSRPSVQAKKGKLLPLAIYDNARLKPISQAFIGMFMAGRINSSARHSFGLDFNRFAAMSLVLANSKQVKTDQQQLFCQYIGCYKKRALDTASLNYVSIKQVSHENVCLMHQLLISTYSHGITATNARRNMPTTPI